MKNMTEKPWYRQTIGLIVFFWAIIFIMLFFDAIDITKLIKLNLRFDWPSIFCQALSVTAVIVFGVAAIRQAKK